MHIRVSVVRHRKTEARACRARTRTSARGAVIRKSIRARVRIDRRARRRRMKPNETKQPNETSREPGRESNPSVGIGCEAVGRAAGRESRDARAHLAEELPGLRPRLRKRRGEHGRARGRAQALARRQPGDRGAQRHFSARASRTTPSRQTELCAPVERWPARLRRSLSSGRHEPVAEPARAHCAARRRWLPSTRAGSRGEKRKSTGYRHSV